MLDQTLTSQLINLCAALLLLLSFAMLSQRRVLTLVSLYAVQGAVLFASITVVMWSTDQYHLFFSAALTLILKVIILPLILNRLIRRLGARWETETLLNAPATMLVGLV